MRILTLFIVLLISALTNTSESKPSLEFDNRIIINEFDTVIISFIDAIQYRDGNKVIVDIPVFITSDDIINALDLSFKIDQTKLEYVEVISNTEEMDFVGFINENDSVFRFTSNSFLSYKTNRSTIMTIRFNLLIDEFDPSSLADFTGFLNGDECTAYFEGEQVMVSNINQELVDSSIKLWPNPSSDFIKIESLNNFHLILTDISGANLYSNEIIANQRRIIDLSHLESGMYLLNIYNLDNQILGTKTILKSK